MTATATVEVANQTFEATVTYTMFEPSQDVQATFDFAGLPLNELAGETVTFVIPYRLRALKRSSIKRPGLPTISLHLQSPQVLIRIQRKECV